MRRLVQTGGRAAVEGVGVVVVTLLAAFGAPVAAEWRAAAGVAVASQAVAVAVAALTEATAAAVAADVVGALVGHAGQVVGAGRAARQRHGGDAGVGVAHLRAHALRLVDALHAGSLAVADLAPFDAGRPGGRVRQTADPSLAGAGGAAGVHAGTIARAHALGRAAAAAGARARATVAGRGGR